MSKQSTSRIKVIKYEDLIDHKSEIIKDIYKFLNIEYLFSYPEKAIANHFKDDIEQKWNKALEGEIISKKVAQYANKGFKGPVPFEKMYHSIPSKRRRQFFKAKKLNTIVEGGSFRYYSTLRSKNFQHDHWKNEISKRLLDKIENNKVCKEAMAQLKYKPFNMTFETLL